MRRQDVDLQVCSIARAMPLIGDSWTMLIIRGVFFGLHRFTELQQSLDINRNRLTERLNLLVENGIMEKCLYDEARGRYEYRLTEKGTDLYPVLVSIVGWGDKWLADKDGPPLQYVHKTCSKVMQPKYHCDCCGEPLEVTDVSVQAGPGITKKLKRGEETGFDLQAISRNSRVAKRL